MPEIVCQPESDGTAEMLFKSLVTEHGMLMRNTIAAHCPRKLGIELDDVMQEAFFRLWRIVRSRKDIHNPGAYLRRIAVTVTIDAVRRVRARREEQDYCRQESDTPNNTEFLHLVDPRPSQEAVASCSRLIGLVKRTLNGLPPNRRRAVGMHLEGFTTGEIATRMKWSEPKARNLVYRGLGVLRNGVRPAAVRCGA